MAGKVHEIAFRIAGHMSGSFSKSFAAASKAVNGFGGDLVSLNQKAFSLGQKVKAAQEKLDKYKDSLAKCAQPTEEMVRRTTEAENTLKALTAQYEKAEAAAAKCRIAHERLAKATALQNKMKGWASSSAMALGGIAAAALPVAKAVKDAMSFEDMRAELGKYSDDSHAIFAGLTDLTKRYSKNAVDMTNMASAALQAGIAKTKEDVLTLVEAQTQAGVAFGLSGEAVGDAWSDIQAKMETTTKQTKDVFDIVNKISNEKGVKAADLLDVLQRQGGAVKSLTALNEKQITAMAGAFRKASTSSEVAATSMGIFISRLMVGTSATKKQKKAFAALGLDAKEVAKQMTGTADGAQAALQDVFARINKLSKDKRSAIIGQLFGNESGIKAAVSKLAADSEILGSNFKMIGDSANYAGSMFKEYMARANTTSEAMAIARNQITLISASIGQSLLPMVRKATTSFIEIAGKVADFISKNQATVLKVVEVAGAIGGLVAAFHAMRLAVSLVGTPVLALYRAVCFLQTGTLQAKVATVAHTVATKVSTAAMKIWNAVKWLGVKALGAERAANVASRISKAAHTVATWASTAATKVHTLATTKLAAAHGKQKIAVIASKVAMGAWKVICFGVTAAQWLWNAAMSANPIGVVIMLIAGLVAGGVALWKNWDKVKAKCAELWESFKKWFGKIGDYVGKIWGKIGGVWDKVTGFFGGGEKTVEVSQKVSGAQVPGLASGGIATKPTLAMIGEGRESEAVLPLSKLKGMLGGGGGGGMSVNFAPVINVSGGVGDAYASVKRGLEEGAANLKRELQKLMMSERRLSYY